MTTLEEWRMKWHTENQAMWGINGLGYTRRWGYLDCRQKSTKTSKRSSVWKRSGFTERFLSVGIYNSMIEYILHSLILCFFMAGVCDRWKQLHHLRKQRVTGTTQHAIALQLLNCQTSFLILWVGLLRKKQTPNTEFSPFTPSPRCTSYPSPESEVLQRWWWRMSHQPLRFLITLSISSCDTKSAACWAKHPKVTVNQPLQYRSHAPSTLGRL